MNFLANCKITCILFLTSVLIPTLVFCMKEKEKEDILDTATKEIVLFDWFSSYWEDVTKQISIEMFDSSDSGEISTLLYSKSVYKNTIIGAIYERFVAIQLNVQCWICAWSYYIKKEKEKVEKCAEVAELMTWYNDIFTAEMFIVVYKEQCINCLKVKYRPKSLKTVKFDCEDPFFAYQRKRKSDS